MNHEEDRNHIIHLYQDEQDYNIVMRIPLTMYNKILKHPYIRFRHTCKEYPQYSEFVAYPKNVKGKKVWCVYGDGQYLCKFKRNGRLTTPHFNIMTYSRTEYSYKSNSIVSCGN